MGRIIILLFIVMVIVLLWQAFGPKTQRRLHGGPQPRAIKGPDDDEEFLWRLEKQRFEQRRAKEEAERTKRQRPTRDVDKRKTAGDPPEEPGDTPHERPSGA